MSDQTKAALEAAVAAHLAAECEGTILSSFVIQCAGQALERLEAQQTTLMWDCMDGQPVHISMGLARALTLNIDGLHASFESMNDE